MNKVFVLVLLPLMCFSCKQKNNPLLEQLNKNSEGLHIQVQWLRYSVHKLDVIEDYNTVNLSEIIDSLRDKTEPFYSSCDSAISIETQHYSERLRSKYSELSAYIGQLYSRYKPHDSIDYIYPELTNRHEFIGLIKNKLLSAELKLLSGIVEYATHHGELWYMGARLEDTAFFDGKVHKIRATGKPSHQRQAFPFFEVTKVTRNGKLITYPRVVSDITYGYVIMDSLEAGSYDLEFLYHTKRGLHYAKPQHHRFIVK